jgi:hypothetical protein
LGAAVIEGSIPAGDTGNAIFRNYAAASLFQTCSAIRERMLHGSIYSPLFVCGNIPFATAKALAVDARANAVLRDFSSCHSPPPGAL